VLAADNLPQCSLDSTNTTGALYAAPQTCFAVNESSSTPLRSAVRFTSGRRDRTEEMRAYVTSAADSFATPHTKVRALLLQTCFDSAVPSVDVVLWSALSVFRWPNRANVWVRCDGARLAVYRGSIQRELFIYLHSGTLCSEITTRLSEELRGKQRKRKA